MVLKLVLKDASSIDPHTLYAIGNRAFAGDQMQQTVFPPRLAHHSTPEQLLAFRLARIEQRLASPGSRYVVAYDDEVEGGERPLGYAGWLVPGGANAGAKKDGEGKENGLNGAKEGSSAFENDPFAPKEGDVYEGSVDDGEGRRRGDGGKYPGCLDVTAWLGIMGEMEKARKRYLGDELEDKVWCKL
jgi:hypothetical protein